MNKVQSSPNLSAEIFSVLKERIIHWEYLPGHRFTEQGLSEEFGVSRSPIREVLQMLENERLVIKEPRLGYTVKQPNITEINELYEVRLALELYVASLLVEKGMDQDLWNFLFTKWQTILNNLPQMGEDFAFLDEAFHRALAKATGNILLSDILRDIDEKLHFIRTSDITTPARLELTANQHLSILNSIKNKDLEFLLRAIRANIEEGKKNIDQALKQVLVDAFNHSDNNNFSLTTDR